MTAVIGYVRVSGTSQVVNGDGLEVQRERIHAFCNYQGLALDVVEEDAGKSGATTDGRDGFKRAMRAVLEGGSGSVLVTYRLDRLGRNALDVQEVLAVLTDAGVRVVSIADGVDSASGMGAAMLKLLTSILATFAELERETINTRLQDGRRRARRERKPYTAEPHYGMRDDGGKLVDDEHEQRIVSRIRELRASGLTLRAIGVTLIAEGMHPRRAERWAPAVILRLATGKRTPTKKKSNSRIERARRALLEVA